MIKKKDPLPRTFCKGTSYGCPECKTPFKERKFVILYKDALECTHCGYVWVTYNENLVMKYINTIQEEKEPLATTSGSDKQNTKR